MVRTIVGYRQDEEGDWVALLSCLHGQHVRHRPPFRDLPWVLTDEGRAGRLGSEIDCPLCDRAELPDDLRLARTAGPFDEATMPAGLRRAHRIAEGTWGRLRVLEGRAELAIQTDPPIVARLGPGEEQPIPPGVPHAVTTTGPVCLQVDFLVPGQSTSG